MTKKAFTIGHYQLIDRPLQEYQDLKDWAKNSSLYFLLLQEFIFCSVVMALWNLIADWFIYTQVNIWFIFVIFLTISFLSADEFLFSLKLIHKKNPNKNFILPNKISIRHWLFSLLLIAMILVEMYCRYQLRLPARDLVLTSASILLIILALPYFMMMFYKTLIR